MKISQITPLAQRLISLEAERAVLAEMGSLLYCADDDPEAGTSKRTETLNAEYNEVHDALQDLCRESGLIFDWNVIRESIIENTKDMCN